MLRSLAGGKARKITIIRAQGTCRHVDDLATCTQCFDVVMQAVGDATVGVPTAQLLIRDLPSGEELVAHHA
ncbi:MAG TPA: hypothetical protein VIV60_20695 [Polyangiaceae bacterium]